MSRRSIKRMTAHDPELRAALLAYHYPRAGQKARATAELKRLNLQRMRGEKQ